VIAVMRRNWTKTAEGLLRQSKLVYCAKNTSNRDWS